MKTPPVCVFSKHLQFLDWRELGKTCKELGLDGIDLTVRKGGHVLPDSVAADLPRAVDIIRAEGLDVPMITTNLSSADDADARPILQAASKLGIPYFRCGGLKYAETGDPLEQLGALADKLAGLAKVAEEYHIVGGYHNHSGMNNVGAPVWDLRWMLDRIASPNMGSNFDIGHAMVEGGLGAWQINSRLVAKHVKMMAAKDFIWEDKQLRWTPLGNGQVKTDEFLKIVREAGFCGPISLHFEYKTASNDALLTEIRKSVIVLRQEMRKAGYAA